VTDRGVVTSVLITVEAAISVANKVKQRGQSAARICTAKACRRIGFRLSTTLSIAGLAIGLNVVPGATAEHGDHDHSVPDFELETKLTTAQITDTFSNVIDRGEVQDQRGISAETHWYADGRFVSRWWQPSEGDPDQEPQSVAGHWRAENDLRCVAFVPLTDNAWSCAAVWRLEDGRYLSMNPDGSIHGLHVLRGFDP
jgi:hypothetical protein